MKFSALNTDLTLQVLTPRYNEFSVWVHQIWVPASKHANCATIDQSSTRTVADRHRLAAYYNKHCWRAFRGFQHPWP